MRVAYQSKVCVCVCSNVKTSKNSVRTECDTNKWVRERREMMSCCCWPVCLMCHFVNMRDKDQCDGALQTTIHKRAHTLSYTVPPRTDHCFDLNLWSEGKTNIKAAAIATTTNSIVRILFSVTPLSFRCILVCVNAYFCCAVFLTLTFYSCLCVYAVYGIIIMKCFNCVVLWKSSVKPQCFCCFLASGYYIVVGWFVGWLIDWCLVWDTCSSPPCAQIHTLAHWRSSSFFIIRHFFQNKISLTIDWWRGGIVAVFLFTSLWLWTRRAIKIVDLKRKSKENTKHIDCIWLRKKESEYVRVCPREANREYIYGVIKVCDLWSRSRSMCFCFVFHLVDCWCFSIRCLSM